jgi:hypothetical protein
MSSETTLSISCRIPRNHDKSRDEYFDKDNVFRLATVVMAMNMEFSEQVHKRGFTRALSASQPIARALLQTIQAPDDGETGHSPKEVFTSEIEVPNYPEL